MKKIMFLLSFTMMMLFLTTTVYAEDYPLKWSQMPDLPLGFDIPSYVIPSYDPYGEDPPMTPVVADDWLCETGLPVTDVHWWGSYENWSDTDGPGNVQGFWIGIFADVPAGVDAPFSHPDDWLMFEYHPITEVEETYFGQQDWTGHSAFEYTVELNDPFPQEIDDIYWLLIAAVQDSEEFQWGWKTSSDHWNDDAVNLTYDSILQEWFWNELIYPDGHPLEGDSVDMAFELSTVPEPATVILLTTGVFGLMIAVRKRG